MIPKYNSFLEDKLFENVINESIIYFSPNLRKVISGITGEIGDVLINIEGQDIKPDITFLDLDKEGYLSFTTMRNAVNLLMPKFPHIVDENDGAIGKKPNKDLADNIWKYDMKDDSDLGIYKKSRNQIKIGKLVNKLFPSKFTDKEIEEFVNKFKAKIENQGEKFKIVEGDDISFWYNSDNYKEKSGSLGSSCMASKKNIFQLYTMNPEVCRLVILLEDEELIGRALLWKINSFDKGFEKDDGEGFSKDFKPEYFMDRQYTIKDSDVNKFRNYAKENGWAYKSNNNHHSLENVTFLTDEKRVNMTVTLKPYSGDSEYDYNKYPYLDTFRRYDPGTGYLYNDNNDDSDYAGNYILDSTEGRYTEIESGVYSEWCDCMLNEDDAVYSYQVESYLRREEAVMVELGNRRRHGWWPQDHDDIVYDEGRSEYIHTDDSVICELDGDSIYKDDATLTISDIDDDFETVEIWMRDEDNRAIDISLIDDSIWYEKLSSEQYKNNWGDCTQVLRKILTRDFNNKWIPKIISMTQYKISGVLDGEDASNLNGIKYLSMVDSFALGYSVNKDDSQVIDEFSYNEKIYTLYETHKKNIKIKFSEVEYKLSGRQLSILEEDPEYKSRLLKRRNQLMFRLEELEENKWG